MEFRSTDACFLIFQAVLDIIKSEFHESRLQFYGKIIESITDGKPPEAEALQELTLWTKSRLLLINTHLLSSSATVNNQTVDDQIVDSLVVHDENVEGVAEPQGF